MNKHNSLIPFEGLHSLARAGGLLLSKKKKRDIRELFIDDDAAVDATGVRSLREGSSPLDLATIKDFFRFHAAISRGRIDDTRTTVDSLNTFAEWFFAGFARVTGNTINEEDRRAVYDVSTFRSASQFPYG